MALQVTEAKKKAEEEAENVVQLEESRKKLLKVFNQFFVVVVRHV